jgi:hypothetical protein
MASQGVQDLSRPQTRYHMGLTCPATDPESMRQGLGKIAPLRVVAAGHLLKVREASSVLDVQHRVRFEIPGRNISATSELEMLVGLVESQGESEPS